MCIARLRAQSLKHTGPCRFEQTRAGPPTQVPREQTGQQGSASLGHRGGSAARHASPPPPARTEQRWGAPPPGATADEFYRRYPADIRLMRSLGVRHFRMSIAWPRVLPQGAGPVNAAGLAFYLGLVEALQAAGIQPYVTLCVPGPRAPRRRAAPQAGCVAGGAAAARRGPGRRARPAPAGALHAGGGGTETWPARRGPATQAADAPPPRRRYHWDLPQALQDSYGGWNSSRIVDDFAEYAATVFAALGQRVTYWTTFNGARRSLGAPRV